MKRYAAETSVSIERSQAEIKGLIDRYGGSQYLYFESDSAWVVQFRISERLVRLVLPRPVADLAVTHTPTMRERRETQQREHLAQRARQSWRALALIIKAKLEAVAAGISTAEREFLADILLPDGQRFGEMASPALARAYEVGVVPTLRLLPESAP